MSIEQQEPLAEERIVQIRARNAARTQGSWQRWKGALQVFAGEITENTLNTLKGGVRVCLIDDAVDRESEDVGGGDCGCARDGCADCYPRAVANADFVEHAPDDVKDLLAEVDRLRRVNGRLARACAEGLPRKAIFCPYCGNRHVDGANGASFATDPHHTHLCERCNQTFDTREWAFGVAPGEERP